MLEAEVPSSMTRVPGQGGATSNKSWKCLLHAASITLWAFNDTPATTAQDQPSSTLHRLLVEHLEVPTLVRQPVGTKVVSEMTH